MSNGLDPVAQVVAKMQQAMQMWGSGKIRESVALADEALRIAEDYGVNSEIFRIQRELLAVGTTQEFGPLLKQLRQSLTVFAEKQDILQQVDTLTVIAGVLAQSGRKQEAIDYLQQAEALIDALTIDDMRKVSERLPPASSLDAVSILNLRSSDIKRMKRVLRGD